MSDVDGPRLATAEEFPDMMELLDRYFAYSRGGMQANLPFAYDPDHADHHALIVDDDRIVSHIGAVPQTLSTGVDGETVECWGIGGVATDRRYRGNGYMSQLLEFWFERMAEAGVPLSDLSGDRQRYGHFGYEMAGSEFRYSLSDRSFDGEPTASESVVGYEPDEHLETIHQIHENESYRVVRDLEGSRTVYGQRDLETLLYDDGSDVAYVSLSRESRTRTIQEFGGDPDGLETLLSHLFAVLDLNGLRAHVPPEHPLEPVFAQHSRFWRARPHRKLRICDLHATLEAFAGQLEKRWLESGRTETGSLVLKLAEDDDATRLTYGPDGVTVEAASDRPDVEHDRMTMASLLFGMPLRCDDLRADDPFLRTALPLRYFIWGTEHV